jgi:hypothetical protein
VTPPMNELEKQAEVKIKTQMKSGKPMRVKLVEITELPLTASIL